MQAYPNFEATGTQRGADFKCRASFCLGTMRRRLLHKAAVNTILKTDPVAAGQNPVAAAVGMCAGQTPPPYALPAG